MLSEHNKQSDGSLMCWDCLVPNSNQRWRVTVKWAGDTPTVKEVGQLRSLVTEFREKSSKELWEELKGTREVDLGKFYKPHLDKLLADNERYGFDLKLEDLLKDRSDAGPLDRLLKAIGRDDSEKVSELASELPDLNIMTDDGSDLLSYTIYEEKPAAAVALIETGINLTNPKSIFSPLQAALETGLGEVVDLLLERKVDPTVRGTQEDEDAIHILCRHFRSTHWLQQFLKSGADPKKENPHGETPLTILKDSTEFEEGDEETLKMVALLEQKRPWWKLWG